MALESAPEPSPTLEDWEYALIRSVAARIRTTDRDDLESVLSIHLLRLKARFETTARNWRAFATTALRNKASNWIRDRQLAESRLTPLDRAQSDETERPIADTLGARDPPPELRVIVQSARAELDQHLRNVWDALVETSGNQVEVARQFGVHRNTVRLWIRRIRIALALHGLNRLP